LYKNAAKNGNKKNRGMVGRCQLCRIEKMKLNATTVKSQKRDGWPNRKMSG
jgi:hypothetical protein